MDDISQTTLPSEAAATPKPNDSDTLNPSAVNATSFQPTKKGLHFWVLLVGIVLCQFLAALDSYVLSTALPTITSELNSGPLYIWIINAYLLVSQPVDQSSVKRPISLADAASASSR